MMKASLVLFLLMVSPMVYAQSRPKIALSGNPADSAYIKRKQKLEANGYDVLTKEEWDKRNPLLDMGDKAFKKRYQGQPLPAFTMRDITGKLIKSEDLKGKFVHINFWSTTCVYCIKEFPELNELKKKYGADDWVFLSFAPESKAKVNRILDRNPLDYLIIANAKNFYADLGIDGYPKNFFVDRTGKIVQVTDGTFVVKDPVSKELKPANFKYYDRIMVNMK